MNDPKRFNSRAEKRLLLLERKASQKQGRRFSRHFYTLSELIPIFFLSNKLQKSTQSLLIGLHVAFMGAFTKENRLALFSPDFKRLTTGIAEFIADLEGFPEAERRLASEITAPLLLLGIGLIEIASENGLQSKDAREAVHLQKAPFIENLLSAVLSTSVLSSVAEEIAKALGGKSPLFAKIFEAIILSGILIAFSKKEEKLFDVINSRLSPLLKEIKVSLTTRKERERDLDLHKKIDHALHTVTTLEQSLHKETAASFIEVVQNEMKEAAISYPLIHQDIDKMKEWFLTLSKEVDTGLNVKENVVTFIG